jgi:hypothetical protein
MPEDLQPVCALSSEDEQLATEEIFGQRRLNVRAQGVHALTHVSDAGHQSDPHIAGRSRDAVLG